MPKWHEGLARNAGRDRKDGDDVIEDCSGAKITIVLAGMEDVHVSTQMTLRTNVVAGPVRKLRGIDDGTVHRAFDRIPLQSLLNVKLARPVTALAADRQDGKKRPFVLIPGTCYGFGKAAVAEQAFFCRRSVEVQVGSFIATRREVPFAWRRVKGNGRHEKKITFGNQVAAPVVSGPYCVDDLACVGKNRFPRRTYFVLAVE